MEFKPGIILEDMRIVREDSVPVISRGRKYNSRRIICECVICGREKIFQPSALARLVGTSHRMCNREYTEMVRKKYPSFYRCWSHIKSRINNPNTEHYYRYGGRGLDNEYEYFVDFCDDLLESYIEHTNKFGVENTTIERKDNNEGYTKGNIRWATWKEQAVNRCTTVKWECVDTFTNQLYLSDNLKELCSKLGLNHKAAFMAVSRNQELYKRRWKIRRIYD